MPRKCKELTPGEDVHLSSRLDYAEAVRVDALVDRMVRATGLTVKRSDVVRLLIKQALDARESKLKRRK